MLNITSTRGKLAPSLLLRLRPTHTQAHFPSDLRSDVSAVLVCHAWFIIHRQLAQIFLDFTKFLPLRPFFSCLFLA